MAAWWYRLLEVNLGNQSFRVESLDPAILKAFLGGRGLGAYLLCARVDPVTDPLGSDNLLVFCAGPLTGVQVPTGGRFSLSTLSPLTHTIFDSNSGSAFGVGLKWAGYDALIIQGESETPVWLEIDDQGVSFHPADELWSLEIPETTERVRAEKNSVLCIGPAGEHQVLLASIMDERGHAFGRGGVGAVMGAKRVKAIAVRGADKPAVAEPEALQFVSYEAQKWIKASPRTSQGLPEFGTSVLVNLLNWYGVLPTRNFQEGSFEGAEAISGESLRDRFIVKRGSCWGCPIGCKRRTRTASSQGEGPEYETIYALGSNLGVDDLELITEANYVCNRLGLDTMSVGGTIGCAMELAESGKVPSELAFGRGDLLKETIESIAYRRGFGDEMANGSRTLAITYGAPDAAMQVKGLEMPGYDPRGMQGQGLLYATSNRGACHLRGNMLGLELLGVPKMLDRHSISGKAGVLIVQQHMSAVIDSIGMCKFAGFAIGDEYFARLLSAATGAHFSTQDLYTIGERIWTTERLFNLKAGFSHEDDTLPPRFLSEPRMFAEAGEGRVVHLTEMLDEYYRFRGWTTAGVPTADKMESLGLTEWLPSLQMEGPHA